MIRINDLHFGYTKRLLLFKNLSLELNAGQIYGLLGQNGAGKTTLLKLIAGLLFPQSGMCDVFGYDARKRHPQMLADICIIPEEFSLPPIKIKTYERIHGAFYPHFDHEMFWHYLTEFYLSPEDQLARLSYGQKKKFLLAFGLASNSRLVILDEPTNGLDIPSKSQFRKIIASSLTGERTFIISTHQVRDLESLIDPIVILDDGRIIFNQSLEKISDKLAFKVIKDEEHPGEVLYSEDLVSGKAGILRNTDNEDTQINMELFFNGIINNTDAITNEFKNL
jgi:ABC-2 type transport system ATP-binding protein